MSLTTENHGSVAIFESFNYGIISLMEDSMAAAEGIDHKLKNQIQCKRTKHSWGQVKKS